MCLYPKLILNRKYLPNKKNGGTPPKCPDERLRYVTAACGKCYECRKQKARGWLVRMEEELRHNPNAIFITLILLPYRDWETDRKSTRLNSSHSAKSRMPSSA